MGDGIPDRTDDDQSGVRILRRIVRELSGCSPPGGAALFGRKRLHDPDGGEMRVTFARRTGGDLSAGVWSAALNASRHTATPWWTQGRNTPAQSRGQGSSARRPGL